MQDLQATIQQVLDYIKGIWIKKRYIIISSWLVCPLGLFFVSQMPDVYESKARVYADTRSMLQPLLRGLAVQTDPDTEIQMIAKTLLSRPNLEEIARNTDLDIAANSPQEFWDQLLSGEDLVSDIPDNRWDTKAFFDDVLGAGVETSSSN